MKSYITSIRVLFVLLSAGLINAPHAKADITTSAWFEPTITCAIGGAIGFLVSPQDSKFLNAGIFCGVGAVGGLILNSHYDSKYGRKYQDEIASKNKIIQEFRMARARKAAKGEYEPFVNEIVEIVPGQCFSDGSCQADTFKVRQKMPGTEDRIGD